MHSKNRNCDTALHRRQVHNPAVLFCEIPHLPPLCHLFLFYGCCSSYMHRSSKTQRFITVPATQLQTVHDEWATSSYSKRVRLYRRQVSTQSVHNNPFRPFGEIPPHPVLPHDFLQIDYIELKPKECLIMLSAHHSTKVVDSFCDSAHTHFVASSAGHCTNYVAGANIASIYFRSSSRLFCCRK